MKYRTLRFMMKVLAIFALVLIFNSNAFAGGSAKLNSGNEPEPEQRQFKHNHNEGLTPFLAPNQGDRGKHKYQYYPTQKVYHDPDRGLYFYPKGDNWETTSSLPSHLKTGLGKSVTIELVTDKPYIHHAKHDKKHPSKESGKSKKNMWSKLIFVLLYAHASK